MGEGWTAMWFLVLSPGKHLVPQRHSLSAVCTRLAALHPSVDPSGSSSQVSAQTLALVRAHLEYWLHCMAFSFRMVPPSDAKHLTRRWSERRTAVRPTFKMIRTLPLRATRALVRRRSSCSR